MYPQIAVFKFPTARASCILAHRPAQGLNGTWKSGTSWQCIFKTVASGKEVAVDMYRDYLAVRMKRFRIAPV